MASDMFAASHDGRHDKGRPASVLVSPFPPTCSGGSAAVSSRSACDRYPHVLLDTSAVRSAWRAAGSPNTMRYRSGARKRTKTRCAGCHGGDDC